MLIVPQKQCLYDSNGKIRRVALRFAKIEKDGNDTGYRADNPAELEDLLYTVGDIITLNGLPIGIYETGERAAEVILEMFKTARENPAAKYFVPEN